MSKQRRARYSWEFKANAIAMVESQGYGCTEAARRLGINRSMLSRWQREARRQAAGEAVTEPASNGQEPELRRLREENRRLREERAILKKAAAFFANESD